MLYWQNIVHEIEPKCLENQVLLHVMVLELSIHVHCE